MAPFTTIKEKIARIAIPCSAIICLHPIVPSIAALLIGLALTFTIGNPYVEKTRNLTATLLSLAVMGMGAGMNLMTVAKTGVEGFGYTITSIGLTMLLGLLLGWILKSEKDVSILITTGTAICGGSAIAAMAVSIGAMPSSTTVALATVFTLNSLALLLFPYFGHLSNLSQQQFGLLCALAIHDTSSVVGATLQFGAEALATGTTVKLTRALWIVPVTVAVGYFYHRGNKTSRSTPTKKPWFILGYLAAAAIVTWLPILQPAGHVIESIAKRLMVLTLFLIGANLNRTMLKSVGLKPFLQGTILWAVISCLTLYFIKFI